MPHPEQHHFEITVPVFWSKKPLMIRGSWIVALMITLAASTVVYLFFS